MTYGNKLPSPSTPHCGSKPWNAWWKFIRPLPTGSHLAAHSNRRQRCPGLAGDGDADDEQLASQPANPASILQDWPPLACLLLFLPPPPPSQVFGQLVAEVAKDVKKPERMLGAKGRVRSAEAYELTMVTGAAQLLGDRRLVEGCLQRRGPREAGQRDSLRGFTGKFIRPTGVYICAQPFTYCFVPRCPPASHRKDGQIKTTRWYLVKFIQKAAVLFFSPSHESHLIKQIWQ